MNDASRKRKRPEELRSQQWFGRQDRDGFNYRSWVKGKGVPDDQFDGRPVIGICNTFSELTPCNSHFRTLAEQVKIGVYEAGGFPLEFPVMSLGETMLRPTAMLYRNLASMDVEESIRGNPVDGVVLLMGCDKTTPSLVMGAASVDLPTIGVSGGPMLNGKWRGQELGSGTGVWSMSEQVRAGTLRLADFLDAESCMSRSHGHCMTMGTASTMASMVEALGLGLPGNAAYPAVDGRRNVIARMAGRRIVDMVHEDQKLSQILTREAFENAIVTLAAIGGSTNAVIHLIAIAGRLGVKLAIEDFDRLASHLPCLVNLQPSGKHLMEDFCYAGGLPVVMKEIRHLLHLDAVTANGKTVGENIAGAENYNTEVIKRFDAPFKAEAGIAVLRGNLAPRGAIIKPSAATPALMTHRGRAVVFDTIDEFHAKHRRREPRHRRDLRHGAAQLRAEGLPRNGRGRQHAAAAQGAEEGHHRHGPDQRCAHERHRVRHGGAAHGARSGRRRAARGRAQRRLHRARRAEPAHPPRHLRRRARTAHEGLAPAAAAARGRLLAPLRGPRAAGRPGRRPRLPRRPARRVRAARQPLRPVRARSRDAAADESGDGLRSVRPPRQKPEPGCLRNAISSAVDWRPRISFRCGKRPKRSMIARWRHA